MGMNSYTVGISTADTDRVYTIMANSIDEAVVVAKSYFCSRNRDSNDIDMIIVKRLDEKGYELR